MTDYYLLSNAKTFAFSAENPSGTKGGGSKGGDCTKLRPNIGIQPGETITLVDAEGPGMIQSIWLTGYVGHNFIIRMYWDNNENPSVEAPISAFFGCAYDENFQDIDQKYPSLNSSMLLVAPGRGLNCYWKMPFKKHCRITMENRGPATQWLYYIITGCYCEVPDNIGYFHASYRQEHPVTPGRAYTVIDGIKGKGQFLGVTLAAGLNGSNGCWVEGEARMYIDGDEYPSVHYTGTEDYFCGSYAFGKDIYHRQYQTYSGLYAGMYAILGDTSGFYNAQQRFMLYRFHIQDPIYFEKDFRMTLDNLGMVIDGEYVKRYDDYTSVAYWYQELPGAPLKPLPTDKEMLMK